MRYYYNSFSKKIILNGSCRPSTIGLVFGPIVTAAFVSDVVPLIRMKEVEHKRMGKSIFSNVCPIKDGTSPIHNFVW
jgi:hypothetical protein